MASLHGQVYKMITSIGWNPYYKNEKKNEKNGAKNNIKKLKFSLIKFPLKEVHLLHKFHDDLYGKEIKVIITGYIRPERDFSSLEELIRKIKDDIVIAEQKLEEPSVNKLKNDDFLIINKSND